MRIRFLCGVASAALLAAMAFADDYYKEPQVYGSRPRPDKEMSLDCIGATGIRGRFYPGVILKVEGVIEGSPADGKFEVGQIITGVNGTELKGINPFVALGGALTEAEASDGKMVFDVKDSEDAEAKKVEVRIPVLGKYSATWPLNCEKSKKIIAAAAEYYAKDTGFRQKYFSDKSEDGGMPSALACLFLLSTGDDRYIAVVRDYFHGFPEELNLIGDHTWNNGYNGVACAEYYLRTGDRAVLPILQYYCDNAKERQCFESGWQHWGRSISPRYVAGGLMNPAGAQVLTTLLLAKECGMDVDEKTLLGALKYWYRFAGHGTVPYGDHRAEGGLGSNGKDGMSAAAMKVASGAKGSPEIYTKALQSLSMATLTSYPSLVRGHADEGRGDGIWRGVASAYMLDYKPKQYHEAMNRLTWFYDLSRRPSGGIGMATCQRFDDVGSGAGVALAYTAPMKTLRITGAPKSKFAKDFVLPDRLWGTKSDLAFLSIENGRKYGKEEPIHIPFYKFGNAYRKAVDMADVPVKEILRNVHHKRYVIRTQAAKALRMTGRLEELEKLLRDNDPRIRRAALDGISDYRYWFHIGKEPMQPEDFTQGIVDGVVRILKNSKESLYVTDGALMAISLMPPEIIGENLGLILPWTRNEEWWIRQSAFCALDGAAADKELLSRVLPTMLEMLVREDHTMPRGTMLGRLNKLLARQDADSPVREQILAAHMRSAGERRIIPGQRAGEGEFDVGRSSEVILKEAPARALELAKILKSRFGELSTSRLTASANGLKDSIEKVPTDHRDALKELLHSDYRKELIKRLKEDRGNLGLVDTVLGLTALEDPDAGWQPLGEKGFAERVWHFAAYEPVGDDVQHRREKKRFRDLSLPRDLSGWSEPEFDDSKWQSGKAPIGKGGFKKGKVSFESKSEWGEGEFLLARASFELGELDHDFYRISVLANQGFDIYLNGKKIHRYIWWKNDPHYRKIMLGDEHIKYLRKGTNHLAVMAGSDYVTGEHVGQIDVYLEGLRESDLLGEE